jgi:hypothetical protein
MEFYFLFFFFISRPQPVISENKGNPRFVEGWGGWPGWESLGMHLSDLSSLSVRVEKTCFSKSNHSQIMGYMLQE